MNKVTSVVKTKSKVGKKLIELSEEQIKKIEELAQNLSNEQIANYLSISVACFYLLRKRDPRVEQSYQKGKSKGVLEAASLLWRNMKSGDTTAIIFYLKTRAGWSDKQHKQENFKLRIKNDKTPINIVDSTIEALEKGEISIQEAIQFCNLANIKANIESQFIVENEIKEENESKEQLMAKVYAIRRVIEHQEKKQC